MSTHASNHGSDAGSTAYPYVVNPVPAIAQHPVAPPVVRAVSSAAEEDDVLSTYRKKLRGRNLQQRIKRLVPVDMGLKDLQGQDDVQTEGELPEKECNATWSILYDLYGVTVPNDQIDFVRGTLRYFIANGTSSRTAPARYIIAGEKAYPAKVLYGYVNPNIRRFARAHADMAREILEEDPVLSADQASRTGMFRFPYLAFDFADGCRGLTAEEKEAVAVVKRRKVQRAAPYRTDVDTTTGSSYSI